MRDATPEQILPLASQPSLLALWTPAAGTRADLAVLFINAGVIHRIGPHRLHVKLARLLAHRGLHAVRFDLSGVGDSVAPRDARDFRAQAVHDIGAVMDELQARCGVRSFVLFGICSGAAHAQAAALVDERVKGVFLIDGYMYSTWRGSLHFVRRMFGAYGWREASARLARGELKLLTHHLQSIVRRITAFVPRPTQASSVTAESAAPEPRRTAHEFEQDMQTLTQRGVRVCLMFTGSVIEVFAQPRHLHDTFGRAAWVDRVQCLFEPGVDHTLTLRASQTLLTERFTSWLGGFRALQPADG
jgi:pimeloyl-ACP methyl ester carboxylesterase